MAKDETESIARIVDRDLRIIRQILRKPVDDAVASGQLTEPQKSVMRLLFHADGLSLKDLSKQVGLAHSTVSGIIDRLERRGMVERKTAEADRRLSKIMVTQVVRKYMQDVWPSLEINPLTEAIDRATRSERRIVKVGIETLRRLLEVPNENANRAGSRKGISKVPGRNK